MRKPITIAALAVAVTLSALLPGRALALNAVVGNCYANPSNQLTRHYTVSQLQTALGQIPTEIAEYSDCANTIRAQFNAELGTSGLKLNRGVVSGSSFVPVWLIVVLALIVLAGAGATVQARRRVSGDAP